MKGWGHETPRVDESRIPARLESGMERLGRGS